MTLAASPATAEVIGRSVLGGKVVELMRDKTWRFAEPLAEPPLPQQDAPCDQLAPEMAFCPASGVWTPTEIPGAGAAFEGPMGTKAVFLFWNNWIEDNIVPARMRNILIDTVAEHGGMAKPKLPILEITSSRAAGRAVETIVVLDRTKDVPEVQAITAVPYARFQFVVITALPGTAYTDAHRQLHREVIAASRHTPTQRTAAMTQ